MDIFSGLVIMSISGWQCPTGKFFNIGLCRVLEKIGSGAGLGRFGPVWVRVGVLKYTMGYFRLTVLLLVISGFSWVFPGM